MVKITQYVFILQKSLILLHWNSITSIYVSKKCTKIHKSFENLEHKSGRENKPADMKRGMEKVRDSYGNIS